MEDSRGALLCRNGAGQLQLSSGALELLTDVREMHKAKFHKFYKVKSRCCNSLQSNAGHAGMSL